MRQKWANSALEPARSYSPKEDGIAVGPWLILHVPVAVQLWSGELPLLVPARGHHLAGGGKKEKRHDWRGKEMPSVLLSPSLLVSSPCKLHLPQAPASCCGHHAYSPHHPPAPHPELPHRTLCPFEGGQHKGRQQPRFAIQRGEI